MFFSQFFTTGKIEENNKKNHAAEAMKMYRWRWWWYSKHIYNWQSINYNMQPKRD